MLSLEDKITIDFIIPYLIDAFSKLYKKAFCENDIKTLKTEPPLDQNHYEEIYRPIYKLLKNKENELIELKNKYYDLNKIKNIVGNVQTINVLPEYFAKARSDIAWAIRNLSVDSWNNDKNLDLALNLIDYVLEFDVNTKTRNKFLSDKNTLNKFEEEQEINKFLDKIDNVLNDGSIFFSTKIDKIITILDNKNINIDTNTIALLTYNSINEYIETNEIVIKLNLSSLNKIFHYLLRISNDFKLNETLNENIRILNQLNNKIEQERSSIKNNSNVGITILVTLIGLSILFDGKDNFIGIPVLILAWILWQTGKPKI